MLPIALSFALATVTTDERGEAEVAAAVRAHVAERLGVASYDVEVPVTGLGRPVRCARGAGLRVQSAPTEDFRGWTDLRVGGEGCEELRLRAQLIVWRAVPVASASVAAGARVPIRSDRLRNDVLIGDPVDPTGGPYVAIGPLHEGEPLTVGRVKVAPDARNGATVVIEARAGGLVVEVPGRLLRDAALGDPVRVLNTVHGVVVEGTLVAPDRVRTAGRR